METITKSTIQFLGFVKDEGIWYADLPNFLEQGLGTRANLMMVDGTDSFPDLLSQEGDAVTLKLSTQQFMCYHTHMKKTHRGLNHHLLNQIGHAPVEYGPYYKVISLYGNTHNHEIWLCPVTEFVFGNYPDKIYAAVV